MANILIQNGLLVDTEWMRKQDLYVEGSQIKRIAKHIKLEDCAPNTTVIHADGLCVLPGLIDAHTHFHLFSRGHYTSDTVESGSKLASFGGVTTFIDFADDDKKNLVNSFLKRKEEMKDASIDYALHQCIYSYRDSLDEELKKLKEMGLKAIKIFTTYKNVGYLIENEEEIKKLFLLAKKYNLLITVHAEDEEVLNSTEKQFKGSFTPKSHSALRPAEAEKVAIRKISELALSIDYPVYFVHLSSEEGLEEVRRMREKGAKIIVETTPTYLFLDKKKLEGKNGKEFIMTPPLRSKKDNVALQDALINGEINVVATDHCAFKKELKEESDDCRTVLPGIPGTEEMLPLLYTFGVTSLSLNLSQIVNLLSTSPAKFFGLYPKKGILKEGSDADIVLFDPDEAWTLKAENLHSLSEFSAYEGTKVNGKVVMTYLRGRLVMGDGIFLGLKGDGIFEEAK